jgi:hypothetical protein
MPAVRGVKRAHDLIDVLDLLVAELLVLDSVTRMGTWVEQLAVIEAVEAWAQAGTNRRACVIMQVNSQGRPAGLTELEHLATAVVGCHTNEAGDRRLSADKNRAGPLGSCYFDLTAAGLVRPQFRFSYSVEGRPGAYELVPYPSRKAQWDGLLAQAFEEKAEAGWASAARIVPGYPDGRLEPRDVKQRQAFAEAHGLQWME